jgi:signal transduction histidine kinase
LVSARLSDAYSSLSGSVTTHSKNPSIIRPLIFDCRQGSGEFLSKTSALIQDTPIVVLFRIVYPKSNLISNETTLRQIIIHSQLTLSNELQNSVKANGPGLNEDQQQRIMTPFYTTKTNGMGIKLSISNSIIEVHKGILHFNSQFGKGTAFYITLPI